MNAFYQSDWFMWVVIVVVLFGIAYNFITAAEENDIDLWHIIKKIVIFILAMLFLPLLIIFGRTKTRVNKKERDSQQ